MSRGHPSLRIAGIAALLTALSCSRQPTGPNNTTWKLLPGHVEKLVAPEFRNGRVCWVYLPPGYAQSRDRYPVLYANDGELIFDGDNFMHVNRICEDLIRRRALRPIIIVAISRISLAQRFIDYMPWYIPSSRPNGQGDFYLQAIRDTLKPAIDRRYRTLPDRMNTAITGMSLGGLISVYAGFAYPATFGKVAGMSPTYPYGFRIYSLVDSVSKRWDVRPRRFYQDTGYPDDNDIGEMEAVATRNGYVSGMDFLSITVNGAEHADPAWENRFGAMLQFLFTPNPAVDP